MKSTETLDSVTFTFRVAHRRSLRGILRAVLYALLSLVFSVGLTIFDVAYLPGTIPWMTFLIMGLLVVFFGKYLSEACEARFTATHLHILDRGRRRALPLESISDPCHRSAAFQVRVDGQPMLLFKDIAPEDARKLEACLKKQLSHFQQRMHTAGHDLSRPAAPPDALVQLTKRP